MKFKDNKEIRPETLYYLSHPYTTYGNIEVNRSNALKYEVELCNEMDTIVINPLSLPMPDDHDKAMDKCLKLLSACDGIIMCPGWEKSRGCCIELDFAIDRKMDIIEIEGDYVG